MSIVAYVNKSKHISHYLHRQTIQRRDPEHKYLHNGKPHAGPSISGIGKLYTGVVFNVKEETFEKGTNVQSCNILVYLKRNWCSSRRCLRGWTGWFSSTNRTEFSTIKLFVLFS